MFTQKVRIFCWLFLTLLWPAFGHGQQLARESRQVWDTEQQAFVLSNETLYEYDLQGRLHWRLDRRVLSTEQRWQFRQERRYTYQPERPGDSLWYQYWNLATDTVQLTGTEQRWYDEAGRLTRLEVLQGNSGYRREFQYHANGCLAAETFAEWNPGAQAFTPQVSLIYQRNATCLLQGVDRFEWSGNGFTRSEVTRYTYAFDSLGRLLLQQTFRGPDSLQLTLEADLRRRYGTGYLVQTLALPLSGYARQDSIRRDADGQLLYEQQRERSPGQVEFFPITETRQRFDADGHLIWRQFANDWDRQKNRFTLLAEDSTVYQAGLRRRRYQRRLSWQDSIADYQVTSAQRRDFQYRCDDRLATEVVILPPAGAAERPLARTEYVYTLPATCDSSYQPRLLLYPNPAPSGGRLWVRGLGFGDGAGTVQVFDSQGRSCFEYGLYQTDELYLALPALAPGAYWLRVQRGSTAMAARLMIE